MKTVQRLDYVSLGQATITAEGFLRDSPIVTKTGIFEYRNLDGNIRREYRPSEEVFKTDSLQSFEGKPIIIGHKPGIVNANNARQVMVGTILSKGRQDGDHVRTDVMIHDKAAIESGMRALSVGYDVDEDWTPGEYNGQRYDLIQRNIRVNHLALVRQGRAGEMARLTLDGDQIDEEDKPMRKIRLDSGIEYEVPPEVAVELDKYRADNTTLKTEVKTQTSRADTAEAARDTLQVKVDGHASDIKKVREDAAANINEQVKARVELLTVAENHKVEKADELSNRQIKEAVIRSVRGDETLDLSQRSDEYVNAAFDMVKEDTSKRVDTAAQNRQTVSNLDKSKTRGDEEPESSGDAYQRMVERQKNAHKGGKE